MYRSPRPSSTAAGVRGCRMDPWRLVLFLSLRQEGRRQWEMWRSHSAAVRQVICSMVSNAMETRHTQIELYNKMLAKEGTDGEEEAKRAYRAAREESDHAAEAVVGEKVSSALIDRVDAMLQKLEKEIDDVDARIGNRWQLLDRDRDGKVTPQEVAAAANLLKDTIGIGTEGVQELISNLSKDNEGNILVEDIVKLASQTEENNEREEAPRRCEQQAHSWLLELGRPLIFEGA